MLTKEASHDTFFFLYVTPSFVGPEPESKNRRNNNKIREVIFQLPNLKYYFFFISLIILLVLLSEYILFSEVAAQIKAGIQPIIVICKIRQMIPDIILPCNSKESHGKKKAKTYLMFLFLFLNF
jgi:hypothetical protein